MRALAEKAIACCRELATFSEVPGRTTRTFLSPPMRDVHRVLGEWMRRAGMKVRVDAVGNLRGIRAGMSERRLLIASHLDTVPNAGAFDGVLGVVLGVTLMETLGGRELGFGIEVIGFSEEEGVRFGMPFIGSRALCGELDMQPPIAEAISAFGLNPADLDSARLDARTFAYIEFHIEQGPVLESLGLPIGVVENIVGQSRVRVVFEGRANHAGTTPGHLRQDALAAAAEWICFVERCMREQTGLVATVGKLEVQPNTSNVIPGLVEATLDVRHPCDETRKAAVQLLLDWKRPGIRFRHELYLDQTAVPMDADLVNRMECAVRRAGYPVHRMSSGAGHDAMIVAKTCPAAMLFLRSPGGISHHPDESVLVADVEAALKTGLAFIEALA